MLLSLVIPVYNEAGTLPTLFKALRRVLDTMDCDYEFVFVNDGSKDVTGRILEEAAANDPRVKVVGFSRNFGHQAAITAGLDFAAGDAVVIMDADLQDPPELLPEMVELYRSGYDVVSAQRVARAGESLFKRGTATLFYWVMRKMVDERLVSQVGDFRLFSQSAVIAIRRFREQHRFMRGLIAWLGLKEVIIQFRRQPRVAGTTKYSIPKMVRFAWTGISSFSAIPLQFSLASGVLLTAVGFLYLLYILYATLVERSTIRGWSSLICFQILFSGAILLAIGLVGDYLARIYEEIKGRPLYVVTNTQNLAPTAGTPARAVLLPDHSLVACGLRESAGEVGRP